MNYCTCRYEECGFEFAVADGDFVEVRYCPRCGRIGPKVEGLEIKPVKLEKQNEDSD